MVDSQLTHQLVDLGQVGQRHRLEWALDQATGEEVQGLDTVLAVADVAALDGDHAHDGAEDGSLQVGVGGQTDGDDGAARAHVAGSLLEGQLRDSDQQDSMGTQAVGGGRLHVSDEVLGLGEVDVGLGMGLARGVL